MPKSWRSGILSIVPAAQIAPSDAAALHEEHPEYIDCDGDECYGFAISTISTSTATIAATTACDFDVNGDDCGGVDDGDW